VAVVAVKLNHCSLPPDAILPLPQVLAISAVALPVGTVTVIAGAVSEVLNAILNAPR